ncbi:MAG: hypothetical protein COW63_10230 [Bacteroidetes bacterium CG18_big_fil_WC_8_21_14_2_50_41_14]|nr:MAG: hypothetical protein COW63_10230 [Bacteroidetes bacterium CG18_big_fil_WC_8_21_14_2_50_41_14]PIY31691.1 MAG: hypothetical protein COZ08_08380 [Bacteroidetes bacterium CG_4_10_14_3_um_filter_42_6]PJB54824.1 MAG: hypothetical protein CO098_19620 [Bacteroidetes bacterium CG_4_9_14_3_um_filter_41_19]
MKKLLFIAIIVFAGIISANAQSYTVSTSWDATANWPTPLDQSTDGYGVWITIQDVTNDVVVVQDEGSGFLHNNVLSYVFDVSGDMQPYIAGLSGTAYFNIYCAVRAGNTVTLAVYDSGRSTTTNIPSSYFVNGQVDADHVSF